MERRRHAKLLKIITEIVYLPMYPTLTNEEQEFVINKILEFYMYNLCIIPARGGSKGYLEKY
jgi:predicted RNA methylase